MADKTAVCVDCGQTDLRERMIKSPRGFVHTFTRRCQNTWQARAEAAEKRVQELEAQLAALQSRNAELQGDSDVLDMYLDLMGIDE